MAPLVGLVFETLLGPEVWTVKMMHLFLQLSVVGVGRVWALKRAWYEA